MRPYNVLFLCNGNDVRSIMAEAHLRQVGGARFAAYSAGINPAAHLPKRTLAALELARCPAQGLHPKHVEEFTRPGAPVMDFIFTVNADPSIATCLPLPGHPALAHWGIDDPTQFSGTERQKDEAFAHAFAYLQARINAFLALPVSALEGDALAERLYEIGRLPGCQQRAPRPSESYQVVEAWVTAMIGQRAGARH